MKGGANRTYPGLTFLSVLGVVCGRTLVLTINLD